MADPATPADPAQLAAETERYKARLDFWKAIIVTGVIGTAATILGSILNWQIQSAETDAKIRLAAQQAEQDYLAKWAERAMDENLPKRIRFAHYFASVAMSPEFRANWSKYHGELLREKETTEAALEQKVQELEAKLLAAGSSASDGSPKLTAFYTTRQQIARLESDLRPDGRSRDQLYQEAGRLLLQWTKSDPQNLEALKKWLSDHSYTGDVKLFFVWEDELHLSAALDLLPPQQSIDLVEKSMALNPPALAR